VRGCGARPRRSGSRSASLTPCAARSRGLPQNSLRSFVATLKQLRQVRSRSASCARAASPPALLGASHARRTPHRRPFFPTRGVRCWRQPLVDEGAGARAAGRVGGVEQRRARGRTRAARASSSDSPRVSSAATKERSEFLGGPRDRAAQSSQPRAARLTAEVAPRSPRPRAFATRRSARTRTRTPSHHLARIERVRSPSPTKLMVRTARKIAVPGNSAQCGAMSRYPSRRRGCGPRSGCRAGSRGRGRRGWTRR
jgi:hypothetical protein